MQLIAQTPDVWEAEDWLKLLPSIEGVVAKLADGRYLSGQRDWVKVKHHRTADCVVIGVAGDRTTPWLVLGLRHSDLQLHHFKWSSSNGGQAVVIRCPPAAHASPCRNV